MTYWTAEQIEDFRKWHENRLKELRYPEEIERKLRNDREKWFPRTSRN
jgi:hypothetical protein